MIHVHCIVYIFSGDVMPKPTNPNLISDPKDQYSIPYFWSNCCHWCTNPDPGAHSHILMMRGGGIWGIILGLKFWPKGIFLGSRKNTAIFGVLNFSSGQTKKYMCWNRKSSYMLLKIRVRRSDYFFFFFEIILFAWSTFYKNRTGISTFFSLSRGVTARYCFIFIG